jgi:hypothetical protein
VGSVPCPTADTKEKKSPGPVAQLADQVRGAFDRRVVQKAQDFCCFLNVLSDVIHAFGLFKQGFDSSM